MRNNFQRISEIIREAVNAIKHEPSLDKFDAFKKALVKINEKKEAEYEANGPKVKDLCDDHEHHHWTY